MRKWETKCKRASKYCIAAGCFNNDNNSDCTFFQLPTGHSEEEVERYKKWLTLLGRDDMLEKDNLKRSSYCVCSNHFDDSQIKWLKTLKRGAVPTLLLARDIEGSSSTSTKVKNVGKSLQKIPGVKIEEESLQNIKVEMFSSENAECSVSDTGIVTFKTSAKALKRSPESGVSNVIIVKSESLSTEEMSENSTQAPKGFKNRNLTCEAPIIPMKKFKDQEQDESK
ncbi:uncharacterized protein LOC125232648 [Leguminivora glycinivorella]|uniref:uncharacterized protein LOC125232648 n=1 Tax=Leguminivora glycinivorella TaxID=1035111 RepID=UPI00200C77C3|nr:uncharacterized protein LOC125232648 [Leguminivora glycinivorella]